MGDTLIFKDDKDPKHTAKIVKKWLSEVRVLEWPSQAPDLNHIQNLWDVVKSRGSQRKPFHPLKN